MYEKILLSTIICFAYTKQTKCCHRVLKRIPFFSVNKHVWKSSLRQILNYPQAGIKSERTCSPFYLQMLFSLNYYFLFVLIFPLDIFWHDWRIFAGPQVQHKMKSKYLEWKMYLTSDQHQWICVNSHQIQWDHMVKQGPAEHKVLSDDVFRLSAMWCVKLV